MMTTWAPISGFRAALTRSASPVEIYLHIPAGARRTCMKYEVLPDGHERPATTPISSSCNGVIPASKRHRMPLRRIIRWLPLCQSYPSCFYLPELRSRFMEVELDQKWVFDPDFLRLLLHSTNLPRLMSVVRFWSSTEGTLSISLFGRITRSKLQSTLCNLALVEVSYRTVLTNTIRPVWLVTTRHEKGENARNPSSVVVAPSRGCSWLFFLSNGLSGSPAGFLGHSICLMHVKEIISCSRRFTNHAMPRGNIEITCVRPHQCHLKYSVREELPWQHLTAQVLGTSG